METMNVDELLEALKTTEEVLASKLETAIKEQGFEDQPHITDAEKLLGALKARIIAKRGPAAVH